MAQATLRRWVHRMFSGRTAPIRKSHNLDIKTRLKLEWLEGRDVPSTSIPLNGTTWTQMGPQPLSNGEAPGQVAATGRFDSIAVDPLNANVMYASSAVAGVWRSIDGGVNWTPLLDQIERFDIPQAQTAKPVNSARALKISHRAANQPITVYAASGLGTDGFIYVITDDLVNNTTSVRRAGPTTIPGPVTGMGQFNGRTVNEIVVIPGGGDFNVGTGTTDDLLYVAITGTAAATPSGIYRSRDGGRTTAGWVNITAVGMPFAPTTQGFTDVDVDPTNKSVVYASVSSPAAQAGVFRCTNGFTATQAGGGNWQLRLGGAAAFSGTLPSRLVTTISPVLANVIFVAAADSATGSFFSVYRSTDTGLNWTPFLATSFSPFGNVPDFTSGQAANYMNLVVDPTSPANPFSQRLFAAGFGDSTFNIISNTTSASGGWNDISVQGGVGPYSGVRTMILDQQGRLLVATDGGIYRRINNGGNFEWQSRNGVGTGALNSTQVSPGGLALHPTNKNVAIINNSSPNHTAALFNDSLAWQTVDGAIGAPFHNQAANPTGLGAVLYDFNSPGAFPGDVGIVWRIAADSPLTMTIRISLDGGLNWQDLLPGIPRIPVIMNPSDSRELLLGADDVYSLRYDSGLNFTLTPFADPTLFNVPSSWGANYVDAFQPGNVTALGMSRQAGLVYAATTPVSYIWEQSQPNSTNPVPFAPRTRLYVLDTSGGFGGSNWVELNLPTVISGNTSGTIPPDTITSITVDPNNSMRFYITTASGGVWRQSAALALRTSDTLVPNWVGAPGIPLSWIDTGAVPNPPPPFGGPQSPPAGDTFPTFPPPFGNGQFASNNAVWTQLNAAGGGNVLPTATHPNATGANAVTLDPAQSFNTTDDILYLGTNNGVFKLPNPGSAAPFVWQLMGGNELPNRPVTALTINTTTGILGVGLNGRGVWEMQIRSEITGNVYNDVNGNAIENAGEPGLQDWVVNLRWTNDTDPLDTFILASTTTDANGDYEFRSVPASNNVSGTNPGKYSVEIVPIDATWINTTSAPSPKFAVGIASVVSPTSVPPVPELTVGFYQRSSISGIKFEDANGNTVQDAGEIGLPGFVIYVDADNDGIRDWTDGNGNLIWDAGEGEPWTTTANDGTYTIFGLTPEWINGATSGYPTDAIYYGVPGTVPPQFIIREDLTTNPGWSQTFPQAGGPGTEPAVGSGPAAGVGYRTALDSGEAAISHNFGNILPGSISGRKFLDTNSNGRFETGEPGLSGLAPNQGFRFFIDANNNNVLNWTDANANNVWDLGEGEQWVKADANGFFQFNSLAPGSYLVREDMGLVTGWVKTTANPPAAVLSGTNSVSGLLFGNIEQANFRIINNWTPIGPAPQLNGSALGNPTVSGRQLDVAVDPTNPNRYFVVTESGGIWRTINGGTSWANVTDGTAGLTSPYMSAVAIAPSNPQRVYASAGQGFLRSTDGGTTWAFVPGGPGGAVKIIVSTTNADVLFIATGNGVIRSTDGGLTFQNLGLGLPANDIQVDPFNPNVVYAAGVVPAGNAANGVYRTSNALAPVPTWALMFGGAAQVPGQSIGAIKIAMAPSEPSTLYIAITTAEVQGFSFYLATYKTTDGGINWTSLVNAPPYINQQGTFDLAISVSPTNPNIVYAGGDGNPFLAVTNDGGQTWRDAVFGSGATFGPHIDLHMFGWDSLGRMLSVNDGGVFRLNNANVGPPFGGVTPQWQSLNGTANQPGALNTIQFIGIATHPTDPNRAAGGSQDNGVAVYNGNIAWTQVLGGDGGDVVWDFDRPNQLYRIAPIASVGTNNYIAKSIDGGQTWFSATDGIQGQNQQTTLFYPNIIMDPGNSQRLFTGTDRVWATITGGEPLTLPNGTTLPGWSQNVNINNLPATITGAELTIPDTPYTSGTPTPNPIQTLGIGRANPNRLFVSQFDNNGDPNNGIAPGPHLLRLDFRVNPPLQTTDWVDVQPPGAGTITQIILDPQDPNTVYVIDGSVWRSTNGGGTWTRLDGVGTGQLPFSALSIALDPRTVSNGSDDILYVGTSEGVYGLINPNGPTQSWFRVGDINLPVTEVRDLDLNTTTGLLSAGTYGRGVWQTRIRGDIRGLVYDDLDGDGTQDAGENGMQGVTIRLLDATPGPSFGSIVASTATNALGAYEFSSIRNGSYSVTMVVSANQVQTTGDPAALINFTEQSVAVASFTGSPPTGVTVDPNLNFGNFTRATVSGVKFDDLDQDGTRDVGEAGLSGFVIYWDQNTNGTREGTEPTVTTGGDGSWTLTGFGPSMIRGLPAPVQPPFQVREDMTGNPGWTQTTPNPQLIANLQSGETRTGINIGNARPGSIRGEIFFDVNADTIHNPGEPGESNWRVYLDANGNNLFDAGETFVRTDGLGNYSFSTLPPGTYTVRIDLKEQELLGTRWFQTTPNPNDIVLTGTNSAGGVNFGVFQSFNPWIEIGPRPITNGQAPGRAPATGRFDSVAVDPTDPNVIYAGSSGGGIWRSLDGGTTWSTRSEALPDLFINTVKTFHRAGGNTVYAAATTGVYKSIDGATNFALNLVPGGGVTALDVVARSTAPNDPGQDILFVTAAQGVFRSVDGGQTWVNIGNAFPGGAAGKPFTDIDIEPGQTLPNVVYVSVGDASGTEAVGVYRVDNAMTASPAVPGTWTLRIGGSAFVPGTTPGVVRLAIAPNAPSVLFASIAERDAPNSGISRLLGIFRSLDSGINWTGFYNPDVEPSGNVPNFMGTDGNYNNTIIVSPFSTTNPLQQIVVVGGYGDGGNNVLISFDSGATWAPGNDVTAGSNGVGPYVDVHGFTFDSTGRLLAATEGGVYRLSTVQPGGGRNWTSLNGTPGLGSLNTVNVVPNGLATHPTNPYQMFINAGRDHTSVLYNNRLPVGWGWTTLDSPATAPFHTSFGPGRDGNGAVLYNFNNPLVMYRVVTANGGADPDFIRRSNDGGVTWVSSSIGLPGQQAFPDLYQLVMDPSNSQRLYAGTTGLFVSNNGGLTWSTVMITSPTSSSPIPALPDPGSTPLPTISAVGVGRSNSQLAPRLYVADRAGRMFTIQIPDAVPPSNAATSDDWIPMNPGGTVSQIIVDPNDNQNVYVIVNGSEVRNWYHGTWTTLTGIGDPANPNLPPSAPGALSLALDPRVAANQGDDVLYLGTSSGVYRLDNPSGNTNPGPYAWVKVGTGLPNEPITALDINTTTGLLTAGTSGRGVWQVQIRAMIAGEKYEDLNGNGARDTGEPAMANVVFRIIDNATNGVVATTVTDANGFYEFRSLRTGSYRVEEVTPTNSVQTSISPPVLTLGETDSAVVSYPLPGAIPASVTIEPKLAFGNFRFATISGTKFEDRDNDGFRDTGEPGLPGFTIQLLNANTLAVITTQVTDANGNYSFSTVGPGSYLVREVNQAGWSQTSIDPAAITPISGEVRSGVNFGNIRVGRIAGNVFNDLNGNAIRTPDEPGQGGMTVQLLDSANVVVRTVTSAADGTYAFISIPFGTYTVRQVLPSGWIQTAPVSPTTYTRTIDSITPQLSNLDFGDFKLVTVSGLKFEDLNGDGIRGPGENGISGFVITVRNTATNQTFTGVSDVNGQFSIPNIGPGTFEVRETQKTGWTQTSANPANFQNISGSDRSFNFGNFRFINVSGVVFNDANGNGVRDGGETGLPGFAVVLQTSGGTQVGSATTDANGVYSIPTVGPGSYVLRQIPRNGWQVTAPVGGQYTFSAVSSLNLTDRNFGDRNAGTYATGRDAGSSPMVSVRNVTDNSERFNFQAYGNFRGGVRVATGFVNGPGSIASIVTAAGAGGGPHVRVFNSDTGEDQWNGGFFAYDSSFTGGVYVAVGDVNGDGYDDIITAPGAGGGPHVKVFSGATRQPIRGFFAYDASWAGGVTVAAGDVDGDGLADIITGAGPGGGPHVKVFSGANGQVIREFFAFASTFRGGVYVAAGDFNGDGKADIVAGAGAGGGPHVKIYNGLTLGTMAETFAYEGNYLGGVRVGVRDTNFDGRADLITAPGASRQPTLNTYVLNGSTLNKTASFNAFDPTFLGGVFVG